MIGSRRPDMDCPKTYRPQVWCRGSTHAVGQKLK